MIKFAIISFNFWRFPISNYCQNSNSFDASIWPHNMNCEKDLTNEFSVLIPTFNAKLHWAIHHSKSMPLSHILWPIIWQHSHSHWLCGIEVTTDQSLSKHWNIWPKTLTLKGFTFLNKDHMGTCEIIHKYFAK